MKSRLVKKFIKEVSKIKDPAVFLGIARILKVSLVGDNGKPKDFKEILIGIFDMYIAAPDTRKKELLEILKAANECKEDIGDGDNSKSPSKAIPNEEV